MAEADGRAAAAAAAARQIGLISLGEAESSGEVCDTSGTGQEANADASEHHSEEEEEEEVGGTASNSQPLGSVLLGEAVEGRDERPDAETSENPPAAAEKFCSACGEKGDTLKLCPWCQCVRYCDGDCQNEHHKEHRHECKYIMKELDKRGGKLDLGTELDVGPLPDLPPREECPICMQVLPVHASLQSYMACCGKTICGGCDHHIRVKSAEHAVEIGQAPVPKLCAFCRTPLPDSDEEELARLAKRVELKDPNAMLSLAMKCGFGPDSDEEELARLVKRVELKDPNATLSLAMKCGFGLHGLSDLFIDLIREAADLGFPPAQYQLGCYHDYGSMGLEQNEKEGRKYYEKAVIGGHILSMHNLGCILNASGNHVAAMRHWRLAASGGSTCSMDDLIECFEEGFLHHSDLAATMQVMYRFSAEQRSDDRDQYIEYLKKTGEDYLDS